MSNKSKAIKPRITYPSVDGEITVVNSAEITAVNKIEGYRKTA